MENEACPSCGARLGGRTGCQATFDELSADAWTSRTLAGVHNLRVDAYAMQHPAEYCQSAKSYAAHLVGLCCGVEHEGDQKLYWAIPEWLDGAASVKKPREISGRGMLTIADTLTAREDDHPELVRRWARDVWGAYAAQHDLAHEWLDAIRVIQRKK